VNSDDYHFCIVEIFSCSNHLDDSLRAFDINKKTNLRFMTPLLSLDSSMIIVSNNLFIIGGNLPENAKNIKHIPNGNVVVAYFKDVSNNIFKNLKIAECKNHILTPRLNTVLNSYMEKYIFSLGGYKLVNYIPQEYSTQQMIKELPNCEKYNIAKNKWYKIPKFRDASIRSSFIISHFLYVTCGEKSGDIRVIARIDILDEEAGWEIIQIIGQKTVNLNYFIGIMIGPYERLFIADNDTVDWHNKRTCLANPCVFHFNTQSMVSIRRESCKYNLALDKIIVRKVHNTYVKNGIAYLPIAGRNNNNPLHNDYYWKKWEVSPTHLGN